MKKVITSIIAIMFLFVGCSNINNAQNIEDYEWELNIVQSSDGQVIACNPNSQEALTYQDTKPVMLTCKAKDGILVINDLTNYNVYEANYKQIEAKPNSTIYQIELNGEKGTCVASTTKYNDESNVPTLYIALNGYSIKLYAKTFQ